MLDSANKIAIGTAQFGMNYGIANQNGQVHKNEIERILDLAWENAIDTMDTASAYGDSENAIGNYLSNRTKSMWSIITKLHTNDKKIISQVRASKEKLTVYPSVILAHSAPLFLDLGFQKELSEIKEKKLVPKVGVSIYSQNEVEFILEAALKPDVIQLPMNILDTRLYHNSILNKLHDNGIEIHIRSVFLQGLFYLPDDDLKSRFNDAYMHISRLKSVAEEANLNLAELSLLWLISLHEVNKILIGVENTNQLKAHLETLNKIVDPMIFEEALSYRYDNENILNPTLWN